MVKEVFLRGMTERVDVNDESKGYQPAQPDVWQEDFLRVYGSGQERRMTEKSGHGPGKALDCNMQIDTPTGPLRWGDIQIGQWLFGTYGPTQVQAVWPQGVRPCFRVEFSDHSSTIADADHLWTVEGRRDVVRTLTTETLWREGTHRKNGRARAAKWALPAYRAVEYGARAPFDPYLFGYWLGDGDPRGRLTAGADVPVPGVQWNLSARPTVKSGTPWG